MFKQIVVAAAFVSTLAMASGSKKPVENEAGPHDGTYQTQYIPEHGKAQIKIEGDIASVRDDLNHCGYDQAGNANLCTKMGFMTQTGKLVDQDAGKQPRGTQIYKIEGTSYGVVFYKSMVGEWSRFLKYDEEGNVVYAIEMK